MNLLNIPYNKEYTNAKPMNGALAISKIIKEEYGLEHSKDYNWTWHPTDKVLVIAFNDEHESLASMIGLRFMGVDLYEI